MRRREFLTSLFSGAAVGAPFVSGGESPPMSFHSVQASDEALAVRCKRLLLQVQEANRRLAEAERELSQAYYDVHLLNNELALIQQIEWNKIGVELSDEDRRALDRTWERVCELIRTVFDGLIARRKREAPDVIRV